MSHANARAFVLALAIIACSVPAAPGQINVVSAVRYGGSGNDAGEGVRVDAAGNIYVTGTCSGTVDFDPGPGTVNVGVGGPFNAFLAKYAPSGTLIWAVNHPTGVCSSHAITLDAAGNVYTAGWFGGTSDFDPGPGTTNLTAVNGPNLFISKLDSNGNLIWAKGFTGNTAKSLAVDAAGNVYTSGNHSGTIDFDPGAGTANLTAAANYQQFVCKLDSAGNYVWALTWTNSNGNNGNGLALDSTGNVYATFSVTGTADLDPGAGTATVTSGGLFDPVVVKLSPAGTYIWGKQFKGGIGGGFGSCIAIDALDNLHASGYFVGTVDFDPGAATANLTCPLAAYNVYVCKMNSSGAYIWAKNMGGSDGWDTPYAIAVDSASNVYTTGRLFSTSGDFDPGPGTFTITQAGVWDIFVSVLDQNGSFVSAGGIGGTQDDQGNAIAVSPSGLVYVTGHFQLTADFDTGAGTNNLTSAGSQDIFLIGVPGTPGVPPTQPPGPPRPPPSSSGEGGYAGATGPPPPPPAASGGEGSFGFGRIIPATPPRTPILSGPDRIGPGSYGVRNISRW